MKLLPNRKLLRGILLAFMVISVLLFANLSPSIASSLEANPTPTVSADLTFEEIKSKIDAAGNGSERDAYFETIKGARVHWTAQASTESSGNMLLDMDEGLFWTISLEDISSKQAPIDATIEFEATIADYSRFLGLNHLDLNNVKILSITGGPPTATPTSTHTSAPTVTPTATNTATSTATPTSTAAASLLIGRNTNLRVGPGQNFPVTQQVQKGTAIAVYGRNEKGDWLLVDPAAGLWMQAWGATLSAPIDSLPLAPTLTPTPTRTPIPSRTPLPTKTPIPTRTPIPAISIQTIYDNLNHMTELQFNEYKKEIAGKPVRERVTIGNVDDKSNLSLSGDWSPFLFNVSDFCVVVRQVPKDVALKLDPGETVELEAMIQGVVGNWNYYFNCENTLILTYKSLH